MADEQLDILIRTQADTAGSQQVRQEMTKLQEAGVKANEEIGKKTEWLTGRKRELKEALKGVATQFPELAHVAHLALNPVTLAVSGIVGAFGIWKTRVDGLTQAMAGMQLPNVSPEFASRVAGLSDAWGRYADALIKAREAGNALEKQSARNVAAIDNELKLRLQLIEAEKNLAAARGGDKLGTEEKAANQKTAAERAAGQAKLDEGLNTAAELSKRADKRRWEAAGIRVADPAADAEIEAELKKQHDEGQRAKGEASGWIDRIDKFRAEERNPYSLTKDWLKFRITQRYGYTMTPEEAKALEVENVATAEVPINRYNNWMRDRKKGRARQRAHRDELLAGAAADEGAAWSGMEDYQFGQEQLNKSSSAAAVVNAMAALTRALTERAAGLHAYDELGNKAHQGIKSGRNVQAEIQAIAEQRKYNAAVEAYINDLERQIQGLRHR
jgi:hypothetical protein